MIFNIIPQQMFRDVGDYQNNEEQKMFLLVLSIQRPAFVDIFITGKKKFFFSCSQIFCSKSLAGFVAKTAPVMSRNAADDRDQQPTRH